MFTDPEAGLVAIQNKILGETVEPAGAEDHLHKVDIRIRRLKEMMRCVIASLPYSLPVSRRDDLVAYVTSRKNLGKLKH